MAVSLAMEAGDSGQGPTRVWRLSFEPLTDIGSRVATQALSLAGRRGLDACRASAARGGASAGGAGAPAPAGAGRSAADRPVPHGGHAGGARSRRRVQRGAGAEAGASQPGAARGPGGGGGPGREEARGGRRGGAGRGRRAGQGWRDGQVGKTLVSAEAGALASYALAAPGPVVIDDLARETRFTSPSHLEDRHVVSGVCVVVQGRERPWGVLGAYSAQHSPGTLPSL